jgi:hypothetical protein
MVKLSEVFLVFICLERGMKCVKGMSQSPPNGKIIKRRSSVASYSYLPGISDHAFRSTSLTYVAESFASLQIDKWRDMGDDRSKFTNQPVIV